MTDEARRQRLIKIWDRVEKSPGDDQDIDAFVDFDWLPDDDLEAAGDASPTTTCSPPKLIFMVRRSDFVISPQSAMDGGRVQYTREILCEGMLIGRTKHTKYL